MTTLFIITFNSCYFQYKM